MPVPMAHGGVSGWLAKSAPPPAESVRGPFGGVAADEGFEPGTLDLAAELD